MSRRIWRLFVALVITFSMTAALNACGDDDDEEATDTTAAEEDTDTTEGDAKTYAFSAPEGLTAGAAQFNLVNNGEEPHHAQLVRVNDDATLEDVVAFFDGEAPPGPPPFSSQGGIQAIMPGASQKADFDLEPGEYVLFCAIPDPADGVPHYKKGMVTAVTAG